jgi:hypothetical protein
MKKISRLIVLVKDIATSFLINQNIDLKRMESDFDKETAKELQQRLKDSEQQKSRATIIKKIEEEKNKSWKRIRKEIDPFPKMYFFKKIARIAAVFAGLIGLMYFIYDNKPESVVQKKLISEDEIVLKLANGDTQIITANGDTKIVDHEGEVIGAQKGREINYQNDTKTPIKKLIFNELRVPYGKTFALVLSDGTEVHLNSGTVLKYPVKFLKEKNRQVYLTGEAYFKVSEDKDHPFIVQSNDLNVRVLGTSFNVSSYPENKNIFTVLVNGSVRLYDKDEPYSEEKSKLLKPGRKAKWNKINQKISIKKVDTSIYTSWIDGILVIEGLRFRQIIKRLERHYNVKIINHNKELDKQAFTATFRVENIQEVLESFKANFPFDYHNEGNIITIN